MGIVGLVLACTFFFKCNLVGVCMHVNVFVLEH